MKTITEERLRKVYKRVYEEWAYYEYCPSEDEYIDFCQSSHLLKGKKTLRDLIEPGYTVFMKLINKNKKELHGSH